MKKTKSVFLVDSEKVRNIVIQVDLEKGKTGVISAFSAWENLALIMEGLAVTAQKCINEGMGQEEVYQAIKKYMEKVMGSYLMEEIS